MKFPRTGGILLHPTSLPGKFGIGDLGPTTFEFIDQLAAAGQTYWQMLPLGPTGYGDSPYQSFSAFAGNLLLISPEKLKDDRLISSDIVDQISLPASDRVDYGGVFERKSRMLPAAFENFKKASGLHDEFDRFTDENEAWLNDFAALSRNKGFAEPKAMVRMGRKVEASRCRSARGSESVPQ